jgi:hypothetical protein
MVSADKEAAVRALLGGRHWQSGEDGRRWHQCGTAIKFDMAA